jgi:hypothetical protein
MMSGDQVITRRGQAAAGHTHPGTARTSPLLKPEHALKLLALRFRGTGRRWMGFFLAIAVI